MTEEVLDSELSSNEEDVVFAGFWIRVGAALIDGLVLIPVLGISFYNQFYLKSLPVQLVVILLTMLYKPFMEAKFGATVGKIALKLNVVNEEFRNINMSQAVMRDFPFLLSQFLSLYTTIMLFQADEFLTTDNWMAISQMQQQVTPMMLNMGVSVFLMISCIIVAFTETKQGLHDMIAKTYCIRKTK